MTALSITVRHTFDGEDERGRVVAFDVTIGRRTYTAGAAVAVDRERGWRRLFRPYRRPRLYLSPDLEPRMDRDLDTLQLVAAAVTKAAAR